MVYRLTRALQRTGVPLGRRAVQENLLATVAVAAPRRRRSVSFAVMRGQEMTRSPAYSFIKEHVELEFQKLEKDKVTAWAFFLSRKGLRLTNFLGIGGRS